MSNIFGDFCNWVGGFFHQKTATQDEVIPDHVYDQCWEHNPNKDTIVGASDVDRPEDNPEW